MSEKTILAMIEELATDPQVKACLLELTEFERGSESGRTYTAEYKSVLQRYVTEAPYELDGEMP